MRIKGSVSATIAALCVGMATPAAADVDVYGKINISLQSTDEAGADQIELRSNASRFGLKGSEELSDGLEVIYKLEWEVDPVDQGNTSANHIKARNQFVGLRGGFGEFLVGRHDTPMKKAQAKVDLFNDIEGDIKNLFNGEVRASNIIQYSSPKIGDVFTIRIAAIPGEAPGTSNNGLADATSISGEYNNDNLTVGVALDADVDGAGVDTTRLVGQYKMDNMQFGLMWQSTDVAFADEDGFLASFSYKMGDNTFKIQHGDADIWLTGEGGGLESQTSIGMDHKLGKSTKLYGFYTTGDIGGTNLSNDYVGFGIEHKF